MQIVVPLGAVLLDDPPCLMSPAECGSTTQRSGRAAKLLDHHLSGGIFAGLRAPFRNTLSPKQLYRQNKSRSKVTQKSLPQGHVHRRIVLMKRCQKPSKNSPRKMAEASLCGHMSRSAMRLQSTDPSHS